MAKDPVCGMHIDDKQAAAESDYKGKPITSARQAANKNSTQYAKKTRRAN